MLAAPRIKQLVWSTVTGLVNSDTLNILYKRLGHDALEHLTFIFNKMSETSYQQHPNGCTNAFVIFMKTSLDQKALHKELRSYGRTLKKNKYGQNFLGTYKTIKK